MKIPSNHMIFVFFNPYPSPTSDLDIRVGIHSHRNLRRLPVRKAWENKALVGYAEGTLRARGGSCSSYKLYIGPGIMMAQTSMFTITTSS